MKPPNDEEAVLLSDDECQRIAVDTVLASDLPEDRTSFAYAMIRAGYRAGLIAMSRRAVSRAIADHDNRNGSDRRVSMSGGVVDRANAQMNELSDAEVCAEIAKAFRAAFPAITFAGAVWMPTSRERISFRAGAAATEAAQSSKSIGVESDDARLHCQEQQAHGNVVEPDAHSARADRNSRYGHGEQTGTNRDPQAEVDRSASIAAPDSNEVGRMVERLRKRTVAITAGPLMSRQVPDRDCHEAAALLLRERERADALARELESALEDSVRLNWVELTILDGSHATVWNDIVYACQRAYEGFGRGPALRSIIDGSRQQASDPDAAQVIDAARAASEPPNAK